MERCQELARRWRRRRRWAVYMARFAGGLLWDSCLVVDHRARNLFFLLSPPPLPPLLPTLHPPPHSPIRSQHPQQPHLLLCCTHLSRNTVRRSAARGGKGRGACARGGAERTNRSLRQPFVALVAVGPKSSPIRGGGDGEDATTLTSCLERKRHVSSSFDERCRCADGQVWGR